jgi:hypothetical protein
VPFAKSLAKTFNCPLPVTGAVFNGCKKFGVVLFFFA